MALTVEAAAMAQVPLAGTDWIPGRERQGGAEGPQSVDGDDARLEQDRKGQGHALFSDLLRRSVGTPRSKLVPAEAIAEMSRAGAGFAGFATWLDLSPADSDMFAIRIPTA